MSKTAIFLKDEEIDLIIKLLIEYEENSFSSISHKENDKLFALIDTFKTRGVVEHINPYIKNEVVE